MPSLRIRAAGLAAALAVAGLAVWAWNASREPDAAPREPPRAQLWVDADGGGCVRRPVPRTYVPGDACPSLAAAWEKARPGDTALVRPGRYRGAGNTLEARAEAVAPSVVIRAEPRGAAVLEELTVLGAAHVGIDGFDIVPDEAITDNNDKVIDVSDRAHDVVLEHLDMDLGGAVRDGLGVSGGIRRLRVTGSELCCNAGDGSGIGGKLVQIQDAGGAFGPNADVTLDGNRIHTNLQGGSGDHMECLYIASVTQLTLSRNHFFDCALNTLEGAFGSVPQVDWVIESNVFEHADGGLGGVPPDLSGCHERSGWIVQHNYFARGFDACDGTGMVIRSNVGRAGGCLSGAEYSHNVWSDAHCSATDVEDPAVEGTAAYRAASAPEAKGAADYRPLPGAPQVDAGDPEHCPERDRDGRRRPAGRCDAGPYELPSGG